MERFCRPSRWCAGAASLLALALGVGRAQAGLDETEAKRQMRQLQQQNEALQQQMRKQQELIDELIRKVNQLQITDDQLKAEREQAGQHDDAQPRAASPVAAQLGKIHLSGEGGVGFFHSQPQGQFPNSEFRVDEAKLVIEAPIWGEVYVFSEINLFTREQGGPELKAGELYLDAENLSRLWQQDRQLNLRVGRFDIPFGEEYLTRDAIDNP